MADFKKAERHAKDTLKNFGLIRPPVDPEAIAEAMGVPVVYAKFSPGITDKVSGYIQFDPLRIVVNEDIRPARKTFTIAHELGHYLMHQAYAKSQNYQVLPRNNEHPTGKPDEEKEADAFAASLLVPLDLLRRYKDVASPLELSRMFLVSEDVILNRLKWV